MCALVAAPFCARPLARTPAAKRSQRCAMRARLRGPSARTREQPGGKVGGRRRGAHIVARVCARANRLALCADAMRVERKRVRARAPEGRATVLRYASQRRKRSHRRARAHGLVLSLSPSFPSAHSVKLNSTSETRVCVRAMRPDNEMTKEPIARSRCINSRPRHRSIDSLARDIGTSTRACVRLSLFDLTRSLR